MSGGSALSASWIWAATTVTVQTVVCGSALFGVNVYDDAGEELRLYATGVPLGHSSLNELVVALTGSLKLTVMLEPALTAVAPSTGLVDVTVGGVSVVNENT